MDTTTTNTDTPTLSEVVQPTIKSETPETTTNTEAVPTTTEITTTAIVAPPQKNNGVEAKIKKEFLYPFKKQEKPEAIDKAAKKKEFRNQSKESMKDKLCAKVGLSLECEFGDKCKFSHDVADYLSKKPKQTEGTKCNNYELYGECKYGLNCLFGNDHIVNNRNITNPDKIGKLEKPVNINEISNETSHQLKSNNYPFPRSDEYFKTHNITARQLKGKGGYKGKDRNIQDNKRKAEAELAAKATETTTTETTATTEDNGEEQTVVKKIKVGEESENATAEPTKVETTTTTTTETKQSHENTEIHIDTPLKSNEKKQFNFDNQLILAPLTTVGNLPFRRICKGLGADITIGEMALTTKILEGGKSELALMKRHASEDKFGVQICGSYVDSAIRCAEFIENEIETDFVDINSGCPIDLICNMGAGAALMERPKKIQQLLQGISTQLTCPTTIKIRIGKSESDPTAHKLIPQLGDWGAAAVTLHGRSRSQRYSRLANWEYIKECSSGSKIPLIGNGDIYNYKDVVNVYDSSKVSSMMIARGALIKPWIFTEIKEKRDWDITATERLEFIRLYAGYGLDHWGSDRIGVDNTRKFLLNWISFSHRYIPVGILESVHAMNERPQPFFGRNELETLLASPNVKDWIKITEMFLGKVTDDYIFVPKHNSNSYEAQG